MVLIGCLSVNLRESKWVSQPAQRVNDAIRTRRAQYGETKDRDQCERGLTIDTTIALFHAKKWSSNLTLLARFDLYSYHNEVGPHGVSTNK